MNMMDELDDKSMSLPSGAPGWLLPLVSMMTMLLAICIMLLSISRPDMARLAQANASIRAALGVEAAPLSEALLSAGDARSTLQQLLEFDQAVQLVRIKEKLAALPGQNADATRGLEVKLVEQGFLIRLPRATLFADGLLTLRPEARPLLKQMAELFAKVANKLQITSLIDVAKPPAGLPLTSAWALTAAEAAVVADFFVTDGQLPPARVMAMGADHPTLRASASSEAEARSLLPRIEILLSRELLADAAPRPVATGESSPTAPSGASH
ncbi:MAG: hypothetical protein HQL95_15460 [Magnetococcales bacterium]|nr:hypothetical protein [Magnetococcales bacterium]